MESRIITVTMVWGEEGYNTLLTFTKNGIRQTRSFVRRITRFPSMRAAVNETNRIINEYARDPEHVYRVKTCMWNDGETFFMEKESVTWYPHR